MMGALDVMPELAGSIERGVLARTHGRVRDLRVELSPGTVVLRGTAPTYHTKQLALVGAMDVLSTHSVVNAIEVR
jgi:hypothetical protein